MTSWKHISRTADRCWILCHAREGTLIGSQDPRQSAKKGLASAGVVKTAIIYCCVVVLYTVVLCQCCMLLPCLHVVFSCVQLNQALAGKFNAHVHVEYEWRLQHEDLDESDEDLDEKVRRGNNIRHAGIHMGPSSSRDL